MNIFHKTQKKETRRLPMTGKVKKGFRYYCMAVLSLTAILRCLQRLLPQAIRLPLSITCPISFSALSVRLV